MKPTLFELEKILEILYPKNLASPWDSVGLVCGDESHLITKINLCIDPSLEVIEESIKNSVDLIISHHPLILEPEENKEIVENKKKLLDKLTENKIALFVIHTNGDVAQGGVNDSLADLLEITNTKPIDEFGLGRVGSIPIALSVKDFVNQVNKKVERNKSAILVSGNVNKKISKIAICGGSGSSLLSIVRGKDVDLFLTADLKHHAVLDNLELNGPVLVSISHWASEVCWLPNLKKQIKEELEKLDLDCAIHLSEINTDPWTFSIGSEA
jgi:dinuclear metal center YbgI/SA1388 family protein